MSGKRIETVALHAGQEVPDPATGARAVPIYQTSSYVFKDTGHAASLFALQQFGNIYSRIMNPTNDVFEKRIAAIEGGTGALAVASGQAAETLALLNITRLGDEIVSGNNLYGGTYQLLHYTFPKLGRTTRFVDSQDVEAFKRAITEKTRAVYAETIGNPKLDVPDFEAIARVAHAAGVPFIVDNTVGVGLVRPIDYGADILCASATKFIGGHGTSIGGVIVDSGTFNWGNGKFPDFTDPDPSYHGLKFWEAFGNVPDMGNVAFIVKARVHLLRDLGPCLSPFNSFLFLQGLETLPLRQRQHSANALEVARFLKGHPLVSWVSYPGLADHPEPRPGDEVPRRQFRRAGRFRDQGGAGGGEEVHRIGASSCRTWPTSATRRASSSIRPRRPTSSLTKKEQEATGVTEDFLRLSIGLENVEDIKEDLDQALKKAAA